VPSLVINSFLQVSHINCLNCNLPHLFLFPLKVYGAPMYTYQSSRGGRGRGRGNEVFVVLLAFFHTVRFNLFLYHDLEI
jgi:hypothetical protein